MYEMRGVTCMVKSVSLSLTILQPNDTDSGWEADDEGSESEVEVTITSLLVS